MFKESLYVAETPELGGGAGGARASPPSFGISVNPIRTKGGRLCPPYYYYLITTCPHLFGRCRISGKLMVSKNTGLGAGWYSRCCHLAVKTTRAYFTPPLWRYLVEILTRKPRHALSLSLECTNSKA